MFCINYESKLIYPNNNIQTALDIDRITTDRQTYIKSSRYWTSIIINKAHDKD